MVMQELNLLPTLSVAENLFLNRLPQNGGLGWIDRTTLREDARHAMAQVGLDAIDPDTLVRRTRVSAISRWSRSRAT